MKDDDEENCFFLKAGCQKVIALIQIILGYKNIKMFYPSVS